MKSQIVDHERKLRFRFGNDDLRNPRRLSHEKETVKAFEGPTGLVRDDADPDPILSM
jgi:hypothetical protein